MEIGFDNIEKYYWRQKYARQILLNFNAWNRESQIKTKIKHSTILIYFVILIKFHYILEKKCLFLYLKNRVWWKYFNGRFVLSVEDCSRNSLYSYTKPHKLKLLLIRSFVISSCIQKNARSNISKIKKNLPIEDNVFFRLILVTS